MATIAGKPRITTEVLTNDIIKAVSTAISAIKGSSLAVNDHNVVKRSELYLEFAKPRDVRDFIQNLDEAERAKFGFEVQKPKQSTLKTRIPNPASKRSRWCKHTLKR
jgi:hypothetical protein